MSSIGGAFWGAACGVDVQYVGRPRTFAVSELPDTWDTWDTT